MLRNKARLQRCKRPSQAQLKTAIVVNLGKAPLSSPVAWFLMTMASRTTYKSTISPLQTHLAGPGYTRPFINHDKAETAIPTAGEKKRED